MKMGTSKNLRLLTASIKKELQTILSNKIEDIILFGSFARGDQETGSDIDFLLVLKDSMTEKEKDEVNRVLAELSLQYDLVVSCIPYTKEKFNTRNTPFLLNVKREGIPI